MKLKKEDYENFSITELMTLLKKATSNDEKRFFFDLINKARHVATKKIIK